MTGPLVFIATLTARPGKEEDVREQALALVGPCRQEPGCISYRALPDPEDPASWVIVEEWADEASFEAHLASPHMREAFRLGADTLVGPPLERRLRPAG